MQLFEISFDNSMQRDPNVNVYSSAELSSGLIFHSKLEGFFGLGIIENHRPMTVLEYEEITGDDPVMLFAKQNYYDPIYHADYSARMTFEEYSEQEIRRFA